MKKKSVGVLLCTVLIISLTAGCEYNSGNSTKVSQIQEEEEEEEEINDVITVGFSQVGAESDWRTTHSESMKETFSEKNGYELIFDDARQKQENQIAAIFSFIQQEVDYIELAPVTETGIPFCRKRKMPGFPSLLWIGRWKLLMKAYIQHG